MYCLCAHLVALFVRLGICRPQALYLKQPVSPCCSVSHEKDHEELAVLLVISKSPISDEKCGGHLNSDQGLVVCTSKQVNRAGLTGTC